MAGNLEFHNQYVLFKDISILKARVTVLVQQIKKKTLKKLKICVFK